MSASKKRKAGSDGANLAAIKDLLATTKGQLEAEPKTAVKGLHRIAGLVEGISLKDSPEGNAQRDWLDQEGVNLWNVSSLVRSHTLANDKKKQADDADELVGALRLAAFRLVEAGLELRPGIESLIHVLQLASKAGATLSESGRNDLAGIVLTSAAKFEELLRNAEDPETSHRQARASAIIVYFSSRMEAAAKEGNHTVAEFMAQKITSDEQRLSLLSPHDRTLLALKFHGIGRTILPINSNDAVGWLQKAFALVDTVSEEELGSEGKLKISILRSLARAYFLSGSYDRAEATLDELVPTIDKDDEPGRPKANSESAGYQELRWLRLAILKRRKASEPALLDAFTSIVDHMELTESNLTDVLQDLRTISHQHALVTTIHQHCLKRTCKEAEDGSGFTDRLLLSLIVHCAKDDDHGRSIGVIESTLTSLSEAGYELASVPTTACLTLLWQYGDRHYTAKRWTEAADWFCAGSHKVFRMNSPGNAWAKCYRKAALCYIEQREYAKASAVVRRCPMNEAATQYVIFLTAVYQGIDNEAIKSVQEMVKCTDFDRRMLLLATQVSHESENRAILLATLKALLNTLKVSGDETIVEAVTLVRCIIKLVLRLLTEPTANKPVLVDTLLEQFRTSKTFVDISLKQKTINLISKDISWLWRTAYNCAVQGCAEWEAGQGRITALFEITRDLLETCCQSSPVDVDADVYTHFVISSFSAVAGRVFAFRELQAQNPPLDADSTLARSLSACRASITAIAEKGVITEEADVVRMQYFVHTLRVFEVEVLTRLGEWEGVRSIVMDVVEAGPLAASTYEAITDILWMEKECPVDVLYAGLEAILRASLEHSSLSIDKFSRWLRAICTIILARNSPADRLKAIGYVEQAITVIEGSVDSGARGEEEYPMDERFWLLSTAYNTGFECLEASALGEAKRWFEASTVICRFVPGGKERADKISETYARLLERFTTK